jgi:predicted ATP-grasp superfamily ATP-dependent carboligase
LIIFGASARAAALSALRAGLHPWCADLFADADLQACCPALRLPPGEYPAGFVRASAQGPPGPWLYTGGLENHPRLVRAISRDRQLWGNAADVLEAVRRPLAFWKVLRDAGIPCPAALPFREAGPPPGRWLVKPRAGAGGAGIHFWETRPAAGRRPQPRYFQEYVEGDSCAALYLGDGRQARLLGVTHQLVGEDWLHAGPFGYCGSIGPFSPEPALRQALERLGAALVDRWHLRGLFGVDCVVRDGVPWPVDLNPRYTASVEVLEYAAGVPALALHRRAFDPEAPAPPAWTEPTPAFTLGKAVLFARASLTVPEDGPWADALRHPADLAAPPAFVDVPHAGERIEAGRPVLTFFARAGSAAACRDALRQIASDLDRRLFGR